MKKTVKFFVYCLVFCLAIQSCSFFQKKEQLDHLSGIVKDDTGKPLKDVEVTSANVTVKTDENGLFLLEHVKNIDSRYVVSFSHNGYFKLTRSGDSKSAEVLDVVMQPTKKLGVSNSTKFSATKGSKINVGKTEVNIPSNSLVTEDGNIYKGNVDFKMLYLNPNSEDFASTMPGGDLSAKDEEGNEKALVSYGMIDVVMTDDKGGKLQLKTGTSSEITFPIPEGMSDKAPSEMPLWSFNEDKGLWEKSGMAYREGDVFKGSVGHFSWVNLDDPKDFCELHGTVEDESGKPLSGIRITVEQTSVYTKADGSYSLRIPSETEVNIRIKSRDYNDYSPEFSTKIEGQPGNSKYKQNIKLPSMPTISGQLINSCSDSYPFTLFCKYEKDGQMQSSGLSMCKTDGSFSLKLPSNAQNVILYVSSPDGLTQPKKVGFNGNDKDLGTINVCYMDLIQREQPQLTVDGQDTPLTYDDCDYAILTDDNKKVEVAFNKDLTITIENYQEGKSKFDAKIKSIKHGYHSNSAQVEKRVVDGKLQLKITSVGYVDKDSVNKDAKFNGVVYSKGFYSGPCNNINNICLPNGISNVRMPATYVREEDLLMMPNITLCYDKFMKEADANMLMNAADCKEQLHLTIAYKNATANDAKDLEEELIKRGFVKDKALYKKGEIIVDINQGNLKVNKQSFSMKVSVTTGLSLWFKAIIKKYIGLDWF